VARKAQTPPKNFEEALAELEQILTEIESGDVGLEESLAKYERGQFLIQHCRATLAKAEKQIESLNQQQEQQEAAASGGDEPRANDAAEDGGA
jgi:exodeoxyribonuclease VII small subunit